MTQVIVRPRVIIADDSAKMRELISDIIRRDCRIVGVASDGAGAIDAVLAHRPDFILVDVVMPGLDGIQVAKRICALRANCKIIMLTIVEDRDYVSAALDAGAGGYVFKRRMATDLPIAIREVMSGGIFVSRHPFRQQQD